MQWDHGYRACVSHGVPVYAQAFTGSYQVILFGDKRYMGVNNLPKVVTRWPGLKLATTGSLVWCPRHYYYWVTQDGVWRPSWKWKNCNISATVWPILMKFCMVMHTETVSMSLKLIISCGRQPSKSNFSKTFTINKSNIWYPLIDQLLILGMDWRLVHFWFNNTTQIRSYQYRHILNSTTHSTQTVKQCVEVRQR